MGNSKNMRIDPPMQPSPEDANASQPRDESQSIGSTLTIVDLLRTSRELSEALTPLAPRTAFRAELHDELILSAQRQYAQRILAGDFADKPVAPQEGVSRRVVLGAAAVGLSSAVSMISVMAAYYWRRRGRRPDDLEEAREAA